MFYSRGRTVLPILAVVVGKTAGLVFPELTVIEGDDSGGVGLP